MFHPEQITRSYLNAKNSLINFIVTTNFLNSKDMPYDVSGTAAARGKSINLRPHTPHKTCLHLPKLLPSR